MDSFNDNDSSFKQRLWGMAVVVAVLVIVLPLILDGAGSESQFRRVEQLRQEPPSILETDGSVTTQPLSRVGASITSEVTSGVSDPVSRVLGGSQPSTPNPLNTGQEIRESIRRDRTANPLTAWVVQAGSFQYEDNAIDIRDLLRQAGFASFVRKKAADQEYYRVLVGPMVSEERALAALEEVAVVIGHEPILLTYP